MQRRSETFLKMILSLSHLTLRLAAWIESKKSLLRQTLMEQLSQQRTQADRTLQTDLTNRDKSKYFLQSNRSHLGNHLPNTKAIANSSHFYYWSSYANRQRYWLTKLLTSKAWLKFLSINTRRS